MIVGIDARAFHSPAAGVRRYVTELSRALAAGDFDIDLVPITDEPAAPTNFGRHAASLPLAIQRARVDLYHAPAYTAPLWGRTPVVLSVHDVSYARHPEWYPYRRDPLRRWFYRQSARRAALILTISEFSKREIIAAYGIADDRIIVTPLGVSELFRPAPPASTAAATAATAPPFLLHVGDLHARRNVGIVVRALARLRAGSRPSADALAPTPGFSAVRLVLVGVDRGLAETLLNDASSLGVRDAIELRGRVPDEELVTLYQRCAALVYPSRYEGFGFPLVEAMACGAPVIAANASAIPEVTGDAAVLLDPDDEPGFADAIARVLSDRAHAADLRARGLARAAQFTWQATAARTADAYRRAARLTNDAA
jgi:glycosyltransferase involved in cell wall biosynthesis